MIKLQPIKFWLFDLDNTLYSGQTKVFEQVDKKMSKYISEKLNVDIKEAKEIQKSYSDSEREQNPLICNQNKYNCSFLNTTSTKRTTQEQSWDANSFYVQICQFCFIDHFEISNLKRYLLKI